MPNLFGRAQQYTQAQIADMLGWTCERVRDYALLKKICSPAWDLIVATFEPLATEGEEGDGALCTATPRGSSPTLAVLF